MVKHTLHFQVDGEPLDLELHYEKEVGDEFPKAIRFNRLDFELYEIEIESDRCLHRHAYYETTLKKVAKVILP